MKLLGNVTRRGYKLQKLLADGTTNSCSHVRVATMFASRSTANAALLLLSDDGSVFAIGSNTEGQLGLSSPPESLDCVSKPRAISSLAAVRIVKVVCGDFNSYALDSKGSLYAWGQSNSGMLGIGPCLAAHVHAPTLVPFPRGHAVRSIAVGGKHGLAIVEGGCSSL